MDSDFPGAPESRYTLRVFGTPRLVAPGGEPVRLSARALAYLVYVHLARDGERTSTAIAAKLWGSKSARSLQDSLHHVRREIQVAAPGLLGRYQRDHRLVGRVECDADRIALASPAAGDRLAALEVLADGFLRGFEDPPGAQRFARWAQEQRQGYDAMFREQWAEAAEAAPAPERLVALGETGLRFDAAWVEAARLLVRGLVRMGRMDEAEERAQRFVSAAPQARTVLREELNAAHPPSPANDAAAAGDGAGRSGDVRPAPMPPGAANPPSSIRRRPRWRWAAAAAVLALALVAMRAISQRVLPSAACGERGYAARSAGQDYQPGTAVRPGQPFTKGWRLRNGGACAWSPGFYLRMEGARRDGMPWDGHLSRSQAQVRLGHGLAPGADWQAVVPMQAPIAPGSYEEFWSLRRADGSLVETDGAATFAASVVVLPARVAECRPGEARSGYVAVTVDAGRTFSPGDTVELGMSLRNRGDCAWPAGSRLSLRLPAGFTVVDSSHTRAGEPVPPRHIFTYTQRVVLPAAPGRYVVPTTLAGRGGERIAADSPGVRAIRVSVGRRDDYGKYRVCRPGELGPRFVSETIQDNAVVPVGGAFEKRWTLTNASPGLCAWAPGVTLNRAGGDSLSAGGRIRLDRVVLPGEVVTFSVPMRAPRSAGVYREDWDFRDWTGRTMNISQTATIWALIVAQAETERQRKTN
ncbi:NBR1-Ig-like domain-containing protein [Longimicrobium sp.]|uniref:NBR1-Ig-like domain-containing protein n=1 Tax=Longimicrobium sp. TaxID=2029185 RepID=UPI002C6D12FB|nr:NBR1-Ig-like domain-containing protein [Longimicrobium sp.]HSU14350.1 NBR1-Ig-like domain-containing protein [Longimicrobium sp.]